MTSWSGEPVGVRPGPAQAWQPRPYSQLLRGPTFRWWRPPASVAVAVAAALVSVLVLGFGYLVLQYAEGLDPLGVETGTGGAGGAGGAGSSSAVDDWSVTPFGFLWTNLLLAAFVPVAMVATWAGYGWRPRWVASVAPGIRRDWLLRCTLVSLAVSGLAGVGLAVLGGGYTWTPERDWPWLLLVVLTTTPLQAAGEEYVFRGWLTQLVGSVVPSARVGALAAGLLSSTLFAFAHGQQNLWLFGDRFAFGAVASWLVWRTGGLEAGIALHAANNVVALVLTIGAGELRDTLEVSESTAVSLVLDLVTLLVAVAAILLLNRRRPVTRLFTPPSLAPPSLSSPPVLPGGAP